MSQKYNICLDEVVPQILGRSQKGQDAFIKTVFDIIGTGNKTFVEFGAHDGYSMSNTVYLRDNGWKGLLIDCEYENLDINLQKRRLTKDNIVSIFKEFNVLKDVDFISIDTDGNDYWLLKEILKEYAPRLIQIESNVRFDPDVSLVKKYDENFAWDGIQWYGASPLAYKKLFNSNNYTIVYIHEDDIFAVNNNYLTDETINRNWSEIYPKDRWHIYRPHFDHIKTIDYNIFTQV